MKNRIILVLALVGAITSPPPTAHAQGTAFAYQGRLNDGATPANGSYDLRFIIYDQSAGGAQQGPMLTSSATAVGNGMFSVTLDFGNQFPGAARWLEIAVRTNGAANFFTLVPRQALTPAPYAVTAGSVVSSGLSGAYGNAVTLNNAGNSFSGAFAGNGANVTNVNAVRLGGLSGSNFWQTSGNAGANPTNGAFLGSTDNLPLEFKVNGQRALRLEPDPTHGAPNVIGGSPVNFASPGLVGVTIAGGGAVSYSGASYTNWAYGNNFSTISGGYDNNCYGHAATVAGGGVNSAYGDYSAVGGGLQNTANGYGSAVPGGSLNVADGDHSFAAGYSAKANHPGTFVWADTTLADFASTDFNQFLIRAAGGVGIGLNNPAGQLHVASASGKPQVQITQMTSSDYARLRMNVYDWPGSPFWEMDVSPGATPSLQWWNNASRQMTLDYNGNLTTSGTVNGTSDRNAKEKFTTVSSREVLDKVAALPISEWNFKQEPEIRHIGPMAQDFYAAFNVGMDDKHIAMVDEEGVALAAIQGLNQKLKEKDAEITGLQARLERLEQLLTNKPGGAK